jgi:hypothetical protein
MENKPPNIITNKITNNNFVTKYNIEQINKNINSLLQELYITDYTFDNNNFIYNITTNNTHMHISIFTSAIGNSYIIESHKIKGESIIFLDLFNKLKNLFN